MKIVTWNCNGAFRNKFSFLNDINADINVILECETPKESTQKFKHWSGDSYIWTGENKNKGIGIFARNNHKVSMLEWSDTYDMFINDKKNPSLSVTSDMLQLFLPCIIDDHIPLLGVWTKNCFKNQSQSSLFEYIGQFWLYLQTFKDKLNNPKQIICGDFNSNSQWDKPDRWWNHSAVINELSEINLYSLYHAKYNEVHGGETVPTFYLYKNIAKPYHIDYMFINKNNINKSKISILDNNWLNHSDHIPLVSEIFV